MLATEKRSSKCAARMIERISASIHDSEARKEGEEGRKPLLKGYPDQSYESPLLAARFF